jgi:acyl carrier protein
MPLENPRILEAKIQALLAEAIQVPVEQIPPDLAFGDLPQWDSMGHMDVMLLLEERYAVEINSDTIASLTSIPVICNYIEGKQHA